MLALLPFLFLLTLTVLFICKNIRWEDSFLSSYIATLFLFGASTEILSITNNITRASILIFWIFALSTILFLLARSKKILIEKLANHSFDRPIMYPDFFSLFSITAILILAYLCIACPPNNNDSMNYHLSRVIHWAHNESVAHYATNVVRQVAFPPWLEYGLLHLFLLSGNDYFFNQIQFSSLIVCLISGKKLLDFSSANKDTWSIFIFLVLTSPMIILQSTSTQNDLTAASLGLAAIALVSNLRLFLFSILGLIQVFAVKPFAAIFFIPFFLTEIKIIKKNFLMQPVKYLMAILLAANFVSIAYLRNYFTFQSAIVSDFLREGCHYNITKLSIWLARTFTALCNELHYPFLDWWTHTLTVFHHKGLELIKLFGEFSNFDFILFPDSSNENLASGGILILPIIFTGFLVLYRNKVNKNILVSFCLGPFLAWIIFSASIDWNPNYTRYYCALYLLLFIFIAPYLQKFLKNTFLKVVLIGVLIAQATPAYLISVNKPLWGERTVYNTSRNILYFNAYASISNHYIDAVNKIKEQPCRKFGLLTEESPWEYPLYILTKEMNDFEMEHVEVKNQSAKYQSKIFRYCGLIELENAKSITPSKWKEIYNSESIRVYLQKPQSSF